VKAYAGLVRDRRQVQGRIRGATRGADHGTGIFQGLARDDVARQHGLSPGAGPHHFHELAAARRISGARSLNTAGTMLEPMGARPRASLTMPMVLAVNCPAQAPAEQAGARDGVQLLHGGGAGQHLAYGLVGVDHVKGAPRYAARHLPGQGRAAMHEDAGHIAAHHGHHQARQVLVAGTHGKDAVPLVAAQEASTLSAMSSREISESACPNAPWSGRR
jgi:hypothetical protein